MYLLLNIRAENNSKTTSVVDWETEAWAIDGRQASPDITGS